LNYFSDRICGFGLFNVLSFQPRAIQCYILGMMVFVDRQTLGGKIIGYQ